MFIAERVANAIKSKCTVQQLSVYLSPIYEYAIKFCFYADHAAVSAIYVRAVSCTVQHTLCVPPLRM